MIHKLQTRLFFSLLLIVAVALASLVLFTVHATRQQFRDYLLRDQMIYFNQIGLLFQESIRLGETEQLSRLSQEIPEIYGVAATIYDDKGIIIISSDTDQVGLMVDSQNLPADGLALQLRSLNNDVELTHLYTNPTVTLTLTDTLTNSAFSQPTFYLDGFSPTSTMAVPAFTTPFLEATESQNAFLQFVNQAFLVAIVVSLAIALLLSWVTSRRMLQPIEALMKATQQMQQGDLNARVAIQGKDELAQLGQSFNQMVGVLSQQEQLRRNLVSDVAHELLTPLTVVRGNLEAVQDGVLAPTPEIINGLHDEVMLLDEMIAELQDLSLAEAGQMHLSKQWMSLAESATAVVHSFSPAIKEKQLTVSIDAPADLPHLQADARRMGQLLRNLLGNALKYTPVGGHIRLTLSAQTDALLLAVRDNGQGIAAEHLPYLFDRFYRADSSRTRSTGGSGLGLAIVRAIAEAHNGRVWVESEPNKGSTFYVSLPR